MGKFSFKFFRKSSYQSWAVYLMRLICVGRLIKTDGTEIKGNFEKGEPGPLAQTTEDESKEKIEMKNKEPDLYIID